MDTVSELRYLELIRAFSEDELQRLPIEVLIYQDDFDGLIASYENFESGVFIPPLNPIIALIDELIPGLEAHTPEIAEIYSRILREYRFISNASELSVLIDEKLLADFEAAPIYLPGISARNRSRIAAATSIRNRLTVIIGELDAIYSKHGD